jgi:uncharacterized protein YegL
MGAVPLALLALGAGAFACSRKAASTEAAASKVSAAPIGAAAPSASGAADAVGPAAAPMATALAIGSVKAGEWDDNANFREFHQFLTSSASTGFHPVDLRDRRFLVVRDKAGLPIPRCHVTVSDGQKTVSFVTAASGRALLFPHAEGLGDKLSAAARCAEGSVEQGFFVDAQTPDGVVDLRLPQARAPIGGRVVDLAFVLDTTGSMGEEIAAVKATIQKVASTLTTEQTTVRIGLVEYKDRSDPFVTKVYPFSQNLDAFSRRVSEISAGGGGDMPEDMNAGIHAALEQLAWSDRSVARLAFVVADAPPHLDYQDGADYAVDMKTAAHRGIQLFGVAASGMDTLGQIVLRQMAQYTGATEMFVLRGGAGPDSTGGGDPISSCGGTHTNYSSGKLDDLIVQKVRRELRAIDADPMRIAGLGEDENAKPCAQRLVLKD